MNILLDTHILLWSLFEPNKLSTGEQKTLTSNVNTIYISAVSFWEIALKHSIGKLKLYDIEPYQIYEASKQLGAEIIPLDPEHALTFYLLPQIKHKDPFDRMLIWQAIKTGFYLMTRDKQLVSYQKYGLKLFHN